MCLILLNYFKFFYYLNKDIKIIKKFQKRIALEHVSAITLHYILKVLQNQYSIDTIKLLEDIGINSDIFSQENSYVEAHKIKLLFYKAAQLCKDPCLPLRLGENSSPESIGLLGYMLTNTANIKQMLEKMCHFSTLIGKNLQFNFSKNEEGYKFVILMHENPLIPIPRYKTEIHFSAIISLIRQLSGINILPKKAYFQHPKVEIKKEYKRLFGEVLYFEAYENALIFDEEELNIQIKTAYPGLLKYFETQAEKIIENLYDESWHTKVRKIILLKLGNEDIDIESIAKTLDISTRTLQNHLKEENYNYSKLLEDVRKNLSKYYLQNFSIDIGTIAFYLGYTDISSFTRSFKKWFKLSPQAYRKTIPYNLGHAAITPSN